MDRPKKKVVLRAVNSMSSLSTIVEENGVKRMRAVNSLTSISELDDNDLLALLVDRPRLKLERKNSYDEKSFSELSLYDSAHSLDGRFGWETPTFSINDSFDPHPMVSKAWEALFRSQVYFRGQPVGTIAAYDHASEEVLNYDQVWFCVWFLFNLVIDDGFYNVLCFITMKVGPEIYGII